MTSNHIPTKADLEALTHAGKSSEKIAKQYGVSRRTVESWRRVRGITITVKGLRDERDYTEIDRLILAHVLDSEIAKSTGTAKSIVVRRRVNYHHICLKKNPDVDIVTYEPCIPPLDRANRARKAIEKRFAGTPGWSWEMWSKGPAWQETVRSGGLL